MSSDFRIPQNFSLTQEQLDALDFCDEFFGDVAPPETHQPLYPSIAPVLTGYETQYPLCVELRCLPDLFELEDHLAYKYSAFDPSQNVDTHPIHKSLRSLMITFLKCDAPFIQTLDLIDAHMQRVQSHHFNFIQGIARSNQFVEELCSLVQDPQKKRDLEVAARAHLYHIVLESHPDLTPPQLDALYAFRTKNDTLPSYEFNQTPLPSKLTSTIAVSQKTFETLDAKVLPSPPAIIPMEPSIASTSEDPLPLLSRVLSKPKYQGLGQLLQADQEQLTYHPFAPTDPINVMLGCIIQDLCSHPDFPLNKKRFSLGGAHFGIHWTKLHLTPASNDLCSPYIDKMCALGVSDEQKALLFIGLRRLFGEYIRGQLKGKQIAPEMEALILSIETNGGKMPMQKIEILAVVPVSSLQQVRRAGSDILNAGVESDDFPAAHMSTFHPLSPRPLHPIDLWLQKKVDTALSSTDSPLRNPGASIYEIDENSNERLKPFIQEICGKASAPAEKKILDLAVRRHIVEWVKKTMLESDLIPFTPDMPKFINLVEYQDLPEFLIYKLTHATLEEVYQILSSTNEEPSVVITPHADELQGNSSSDTPSLSPSHRSTTPPSSDLEFDGSGGDLSPSDWDPAEDNKPSEWMPPAIETGSTEVASSSTPAEPHKPTEMLLWLFETASLLKLTHLSDLQKGFELHDPEFHTLAQRFHALSAAEKGQIYFNCWECAGKPNIPDFGKNYLFSNTFNFYQALIRFLDQTVTAESLVASFSLLTSEQKERVMQGTLIPASLQLHPETLAQLQKLTAYIPAPAVPQAPPPPLPRDNKFSHAATSSEGLNKDTLIATHGRLKKRWEIPYFWSQLPEYINLQKPSADFIILAAASKWCEKNKPELEHYKKACEQFIAQIDGLQDPIEQGAAKTQFHALLRQANVEENDSDADDFASIAAVVTESKIDAIFGKEGEILSREELRQRFESQLAQIERSFQLLSQVKETLPSMRSFNSLSQLHTAE